MFGNLTGWHLLIIVAIVLLLFGATRLPALARSIGQSTKIFREEMKTDTPAAEPVAPPTAANTAAPTAVVTPPAAVPIPEPAAPTKSAKSSKTAAGKSGKSAKS
jgi:sec-independent protein translocase protein TatA